MMACSNDEALYQWKECILILPRRILLADVDRDKWEGGLLMDTRTRDKEELIDLATRKQDWSKMCREVCGPRDYLEEHRKRKRKK